MIHMKVSGLQKVRWTLCWLDSQELDVLCKQFVLQPLVLEKSCAINGHNKQSYP